MLAHGIGVLAGMMIGFDSDGRDIFERQLEFAMASPIPVFALNTLVAPPGTPLFDRLKKDGRLSTLEDAHENTRPATNVIPKGMPYEAMVDGYIALYKRLLTDREIALRIRNKLRYLRTPIYNSGYTTREGLGITWQLIRKGILPGGRRRLWYFLRTLSLLSPGRLPTVISDWIVGLTMLEFAERRLTVKQGQVDALEERGNSGRTGVGERVAAGNVTASHQEGSFSSSSTISS
jgi:hypothetical protein